MQTEMDKIMTFVGAVDLKNAVREYADLEAIKQWAFDSLGLDYGVGDRVRICSNVPYVEASNPEHREHDWQWSLTRGQEGEVENIGFSHLENKWLAWVKLERCRNEAVVDDRVWRYWYGPKEETPEGYRCIESGTVLFGLDVHHVQKVRV